VLVRAAGVRGGAVTTSAWKVSKKNSFWNECDYERLLRAVLFGFQRLKTLGRCECEKARLVHKYMSIVYVIPQSHCVLLTRFGKFARVQNAGINFRIPFLETIKRVDTAGSNWGGFASKQGYLIELTEQQTDTPARDCHTLDNARVTANASVYWRITDPVRAVFEVDNLPLAIADVALNALRANIGSMNLDEVLSTRQVLNERISSQLAETAKKWGVVFTRVEIQELTTDDKTSEAMLQQLDAERRRRAVISEAEGKSQAEVMLAEAQKTAAILKAEGQAQALMLARDAEYAYLEYLKLSVGESKATELLLAQKYLAGLETITRNPADKVFLPNTFSGLLPVDTTSRAHT